MRRTRRSLLAAALAVPFLAACARRADDAPPAAAPSASDGRTSASPKETDPMASENLLTAARDGDLAGVNAAVEAGADLEVRDDRERTPLLWAATNDHVEVATALVLAGADVNALDDRHDTPFLVTGVTGSVEMLRALLFGGPDMEIYNRFGGTAMIPACERGHSAYVREILAATAMDVDHVNDPGWTGLLEAIVYGDGSAAYQEIVRTLIDNGADVNLADGYGTSPLAHARRRGQDAVAEILRGAGAR